MTLSEPEALFALLDSLGVAHATTWHRPVFTVEDGADIKASMPGGHTKNLFLKDKKGALFLLCALAETRIDLNALAKAIGAGRPSFGAADLMREVLGVSPGAVTVFALANDEARRVRLLLDAALLAADPIYFHPLRNDATTAVSAEGLARFLAHTGHEPLVVEFASDGSPRSIEPGPNAGHLGG